MFSYVYKLKLVRQRYRSIGLWLFASKYRSSKSLLLSQNLHLATA